MSERFETILYIV